MARTRSSHFFVSFLCLAGVLLLGATMHMSAKTIAMVPADEPKAPTAAKHPAVEQLERETGSARVKLDDATGHARFVGFGPEGFLLETPEQRAGGQPARALAFLKVNGEAFGISDVAAQLQFSGERKNVNGSQVDFQQVHRGVRVHDGGLRVYFDHESNLIAVDAGLFADLSVETTPSIGERAARSLAVEAATRENNRKLEFSQANPQVSFDTLVIHRTPAGTDRLVYEFEVGHGDDAVHVFVDGHDGGLLDVLGAEKTVAEPLETKTVSVGGTYTSVGLSNTYTDPVVVCTAQYQNNTVPIVTRVNDVDATSFKVRLQNPGDLAAVVAETVHCLIVESGVHTYDGHVIQATHYTSTVTDRAGSWAGELQAYGHAFSQPVVIGQVMSQSPSDTGWSVFWDKGAAYRATPPTATTLYTGKHVAEDTDTTRDDEEVGFIVFDTAHGMIGGVEFEAARGPKTLSGVVNGAPHIYTYDTAFPSAPDVAVSSMAAVVGRDGGWAQLHASSPSTTAATLQLSVDEDQIGDTERSHGLEQAAYVVFASEVVFPDLPPADCPSGTDPECDDGLFCNGDELCSGTTCQPSTGDPCAAIGQLCDEDIDACVTGPALRLETFALAGIDGNFQTIPTFHTYVSPVVVCDVEYETNTTPVVVRLDNIFPTGFDIKLQNPSGGPVTAEDAWCIVMEEGTWQKDGVKFEAQKYVSTVTDRVSSWVGQAQTYNQLYTTPTVIGQVMSFNDPDFSVYWQQGDTRFNPPTPTALRNGKTVLADTDKTRVDETLGFIVFESGHGPFLGSTYEAATGTDTVAGVVNGAPFEYVFNAPFPTTPDIGVTTMSGVDGGDGGWSQRHSTSPSASPTQLFVSIDEDQIGDAERSHTFEQVSYVVFEDVISFPPAVAACNLDSDCPGFADFCDGPDTCNNGACIKGPPPCNFGETCNETADLCEGPSVKLETLLVPNVGDVNNRATVGLANSYDSAVVVCSVKYLNNTLPVVPRVGSVSANAFELYLQNPGDGAIPALDDVYCLVVEEGIWNVGGTLFEAQKYSATITDHDPSWLGAAQSFGNSYANPVIVGQVMSINDPLWSVYWQSGSIRTDPPNNGFLRNGKSVLEDPNTVRLNEDVGFIVFEAGAGLLDGTFAYEAFLTADFVREATALPPYTHLLTAPFSGDPAFGVLSGAGIDGIDGYWPYLFGANPLRQTEIDLAIDEDQLENLERAHTTEQIMGIVFEDLFALGQDLSRNLVVTKSAVVSDNGDDDGWADTGETVDLAIRVLNTSNIDATGVTLSLTSTDPNVACITNPTIAFGDLDSQVSEFSTGTFQFIVSPTVDRTLVSEDLTATFSVSVASNEFPTAQQEIALDLDLDATGGGTPTTFFESFESGFGTFTTMHIDEGLNPPDSDLANRPAGVINADGFRCQYSDPEFPNAASFGNSQGEQCFPNPNGAPDAYYFSVTSDRAFTGLQSLGYNIFLDAARGFTTPNSQLEAIRSIDPINLGYAKVCSVTRTTPCATDGDCPPGETCGFAQPTMSFKQQISLLDHRSVNAQPGRTADRAIVSVQVADNAGVPTGVWIKAQPFVNVYDSQANSNYFNCSFDPGDDGNDEGDFFDPTDPIRTHGPSSTCAPGFSFAYQGDTDAPYSPGELGNAEGPGLAGATGLGTWVEPVFDLCEYRGRRLRIRFLETGLKLGGSLNWEQAFNFNPDPGDDGWFIDDVTVIDAITTPASLSPDTDVLSLPECTP